MFGESMQRNSVCPWKMIFIFWENYLVMASGSPVWLHLSAFVVLTWVWPCCLVTPHLLVQTLAWFNLVRRSLLPPFYPLTQIPRSASGELVCASQLWSQRPLERSSSQHSSRRRHPRAVSPQQYVKNVLLLWRMSELSQPPHWSVSQWWRYYTLTQENMSHVGGLLSARGINCLSANDERLSQWALMTLPHKYFPFLNR